MKKRIFLITLIMGFLLMAAPVFAEETLTNETVVTMVKAGLGEDLIIMKIKSSPSAFDLSTDSIIKLKTQGVNENILKAMMETKGETTQGQKTETPQTKDAKPSPYGSLFLYNNGKYITMYNVAAVLQEGTKNAIMRGLNMSLHDERYLIINGISAKLRLKSNSPITPVFYTRGNPAGSLIMVKLSQQPEKTRRYVILYRRPGSNSYETSDENKVSAIATPAEEDLFKLTTKDPLPSGEYAITNMKHTWEFGIDTP
jgi:hypothetical protein